MSKALTEWAKTLGPLMAKVLTSEEIERLRIELAQCRNPEHVAFNTIITSRYGEVRDSGYLVPFEQMYGVP